MCPCRIMQHFVDVQSRYFGTVTIGVELDGVKGVDCDVGSVEGVGDVNFDVGCVECVGDVDFDEVFVVGAEDGFVVGVVEDVGVVDFDLGVIVVLRDVGLVDGFVDCE